MCKTGPPCGHLNGHIHGFPSAVTWAALQAYLKQEVENVIMACNRIGNQLAEGTLPTLSAELLCSYNQLVLEQLPVKEDFTPGRLRTHSVLVASQRSPRGQMHY